MSVYMFFFVAVQMLMYQSAMEMHVLMNKIRGQQKIEIAQHLFGRSIHFNTVIFTHDDGPFADLLYDLQVMGGNDYGLACPCQFLQELNQPELSSGI